MAVVLLLGSTLRSTISNNDLGWRVWLPGQFVLLIWGVDVVEILLFPGNDTTPFFIKPEEVIKTRRLLLALILIGVLTSSMDALFLRITWPFRVRTGNWQAGLFCASGI